MAKKMKANLEFLLVKAEVKVVPEKALLKSYMDEKSCHVMPFVDKHAIIIDGDD